MVMTSQQIAAMSSQFNQQTSMQMQHAGMLSQFAGSQAMRPDLGAERLTGSAINTGAAIGAPVAMGGMMLAGLDPLTMGAKAAWGARGAGMLGAGAAGLAAAAPIGAAMMGAQYVGGQMMTGMQEQSQLNTQLRGAYGHMNEYGGRGFSTSQMHQIGTQFRSMTQERGPGGEFTTMDELGRLAAGMGRMGMAQGVRDAKEFQDKFKQMMTTVKSVAQAFSTSLEEAQKVMSSMRGAGVFGTANQGNFAQLIRAGAVGGGVATQEMTQIANIGSQISRSVGGRGRSGAVAGVHTMANIGAAVQAGILSEEDIYNQTGQTGAAGRQAMASSMMQQEARFFKSGLGRRVIAAMAQKGGQIDQRMVDRFMAGEMGTGGTMKEAYGHLGQVGRANFIRNEGRLRGEAMAAFGGMGRATVAQGWLQSRGMDIYNMGDREMLFFQRKFKMDRDQADNVIRMAKNLGTIRQQQREGGWEDRTMREMEISRRGVGIEGVKRKLEDARNSVQTKLRQLGSDFQEGIRKRVESAINTMTGEYVRRVERDLGGAITDLRRGDITSANREFGLDKGAVTGAEMRELEGMYGVKAVGGEQWMKRNAEAYEKAGWKLSGTGIRGQVQQIRRVQAAMQEGYVGQDIMGGMIPQLAQQKKLSEWVNAAKTDKDRERRLGEVGKKRAALQAQAEDTTEYKTLRSMMAGLKGAGRTKFADFRAKVGALQGPQYDALKKQVAGADEETLSRIYGDVSRGVGFEDVGRGFETPADKEAFGDFMFTEESQRGAAVGEYLFQVEKGSAVDKQARAAGMQAMRDTPAMGGGPAAGAMMGFAMATRAELAEEGVKKRATGGLSAEMRAAIGERMATDASLEIAETTQRGTASERKELLKRLESEQRNLQKPTEDMNEQDKAQDLTLKLQRAALMVADGQDPAAVADQLGIPPEAAKRVTKTQNLQLRARDMRRQQQAQDRMAESYADQAGELQFMSQEEVERRLRGQGLKGKALKEAMKQAKEEKDVVMAGVSQAMGPDLGGATLEGFRDEAAEAAQGRHGMDTKALEGLVASGLATPEARGTLASRRGYAGALRSRRKGAGLQQLAGQLGGELGAEEAKRIGSIKDVEAQAQAFKQATGATGLDMTGLKEALEAIKKGDVKGAAKETEDIATGEVRKELQEKRKKEQDASASMNDPNFRALSGIEKNTAGMIKVLAAINGNTAEAAKNIGKDKPTE